MRAYYQGEIDYFCAIYAIINASRIACTGKHVFTYKQSCAFFQHLIQYLHDNDHFLEVLYHGTSLDLMDVLLAETKKYVFQTYKIKLHYKKMIPFHKVSMPYISDYIDKYLKRKNTACILRLHNTTIGDHWTVAKKRDFNILKLFDSYFYNQIDLKRSTFKPYRRDNLNHIVRKSIIFIKVFP